jgi:arginine deiminase
MHLDTYFNIAGPNRMFILEDRLGEYDDNGEFKFKNPEKKTLVDVYSKDDSGKYVKQESDIPFQIYLEAKGFKVNKAKKKIAKDEKALIPLSKDEQLNYGANFITIGENKVVAVKNLGDPTMTEEYYKKMENAGIEVVKVDLSTFVKTYGAPHCATQVVYRSE